MNRRIWLSCSSCSPTMPTSCALINEAAQPARVAPSAYCGFSPWAVVWLEPRTLNELTVTSTVVGLTGPASVLPGRTICRPVPESGTLSTVTSGFGPGLGDGIGRGDPSAFGLGERGA